MTIFLILAPFGAFAGLTMLTSVSISLFTAAGDRARHRPL